jgi:hypothetical protein
MATEQEIRDLPNEKLLQMVQSEQHQHSQEVIQLAWAEIERRGLLLEDMEGKRNMYTGEPPKVWKWYIAYCGVMALMYLIVFILAFVFLLADPRELDMGPAEAKIMGAVFAVMGLTLLIPYAAAPFLPKKPWAWIVGIVLICIGMTSACCLPAAIPLLIFWLKPENKRFFKKID